MPSRNVVLVVAFDAGFRRSLEFALDVEGFEVSSHADISQAQESPFAPAAVCAVVDDSALRDGRWAREAVEQLAKPVVLLGEMPRDFPAVAGLRLLTKPLRGNELVESVWAMVAAASPDYVFPLRR
uniref:Putative FixT1 n=1 Tax=uncultured bacterium 1042 TaxID=548897 RepID=B8R8T5_9BACT|nr:putative FixT1 [uncultured bacterium 1042]